MAKPIALRRIIFLRTRIKDKFCRKSILDSVLGMKDPTKFKSIKYPQEKSTNLCKKSPLLVKTLSGRRDLMKGRAHKLLTPHMAMLYFIILNFQKIVNMTTPNKISLRAVNFR